MAEKHYHGERLNPAEKTVSDTLVTVTPDDAPSYELTPEASQAVFNHSPTGFSWGYNGSGPAQLALAILLDWCGDPEVATAHHQRLKSFVVAGWGDTWELSSENLARMVEKFRQDDLRTLRK